MGKKICYMVIFAGLILGIPSCKANEKKYEGTTQMSANYNTTDNSTEYINNEDIYNEERDKSVGEIEQSIIDELQLNSLTDFEKIKTLHDYLIKYITREDKKYNEIVPKYYYEAYGALVLKKSLSDGYAKVFMDIMKDVGMECSVVRGNYDGEEFVWNRIKLDGKWYNIDLAADDPTIKSHDNYDGTNIRYDYFLVSDNVIEYSHTIEDDKYMCTDDTYIKYALDRILCENYTFVDTSDGIEDIIAQYEKDGVFEFQILYSEDAEISMSDINAAVTKVYYTNETGCRISIEHDAIRNTQIITYLIDMD